jgi:hypothetical protein
MVYSKPNLSSICLKFIVISILKNYMVQEVIKLSWKQTDNKTRNGSSLLFAEVIKNMAQIKENKC